MATEHKIGRTSDSEQHGNGQQRVLGRDRETFDAGSRDCGKSEYWRRVELKLIWLLSGRPHAGGVDTACPNISFSLFPGWKFDLMPCLLYGPKNNVTWIETTVGTYVLPSQRQLHAIGGFETLHDVSPQYNTLQPQQLSSSFPILLSEAVYGTSGVFSLWYFPNFCEELNDWLFENPS